MSRVRRSKKSVLGVEDAEGTKGKEERCGSAHAGHAGHGRGEARTFPETEGRRWVRKRVGGGAAKSRKHAADVCRGGEGIARIQMEYLAGVWELVSSW